MNTRLGDLQQKEIVNLHDGAKLGYADDAVIRTDTACVEALVVCGRPRLFGLLGRQADLLIPWEKIRTIGEDTILVCIEDCLDAKSPPFFKRFRWSDLWK